VPAVKLCELNMLSFKHTKTQGWNIRT